jgi:hypothetical protein
MGATPKIAPCSLAEFLLGGSRCPNLFIIFLMPIWVKEELFIGLKFG